MNSLQHNTQMAMSVPEGDRDYLPYSELVDYKKKAIYNNYGPRYKDPKTGEYHKEYRNGYVRREHDHNGTDVGAKGGSPIHSPADGVVYRSYTSDTYGNTIIIETTTPDGNTVWSLSAHMNEPSPLNGGDKVYEGQQIGNVGNTGKSQGNHLHFGINKGDANGNFNFYEGWINPETVNIGRYDKLEDTPYQQSKSH